MVRQRGGRVKSRIRTAAAPTVATLRGCLRSSLLGGACALVGREKR